MSPTLGKWLLEYSGKQLKDNDRGKHTLKVKDLIEILLPSEIGQLVTKDVGENVLRQHRLILEAQRLRG